MIEGLNDHIAQARWFGGKGRGGELVALCPLAWMTLRDDLAVRPEIATWRYPDGSLEHYQLLIAYRPEPGEGHLGVVEGESDIPTQLAHAHDATRDPESVRAIVRAIVRGSRDEQSWQSVLHDARPLDQELDSRVHSGEQSNTNVVLGDVAIMKVFRKLEAGRNLDIEMHDALQRSTVTSTAKLFGWVSGGFEDPTGHHVEADLMMLVELLEDARDGFVTARAACAEGVDFIQEAATLGSALAEVHDALAGSFASASVDGDAVADLMTRRLDAAIAEADILAPHRAGLVAAFDRLRGRRIAAQRLHGDFHLQQTLLTPKGWRIIDFEGEPLKSFDERRQPDSVWRDVAGAVRSFGYATSGSADPTGPAAQTWLRACTDSFLQAYCGELDEEQRVLLDAYVADKAAYEVVYEVRNRPDWLPIPMTALEAIAPAGETNDPNAVDAAEQEN